MRRLVGTRALHAVVILIAVAVLTFALVHLAPGNACRRDLGDRVIAPAAERACMRRLHLDRPVVVQFGFYLRDLLHLDFGRSFTTDEPVATRLAQALPNTVLLMGLSLIASFLLGIGVALLQSYNPRTGHPLAWLLLVAYALPDFWAAQLALLIFAYALPVFPPGGVASFDVGYLSWLAALLDHLHHLWLPWLTLTIVSAASVARFQHAALHDVGHEDWVRTARAKGVSESAILFRHALRNALGPVITLFGTSLPAVVGGAVFVEKVFSWPGVGALAVDAVTERDAPVVIACVIVGAVAVVIGSLVADVLAGLADPPAPAIGVRLAWQRLTHDRRAIAAAAVLAILCLVTICAPLIAPYDPTRQLDIIGLKDQAPSWAHWSGTDPFGRDVLSRVLFGGRVSLGIAILAALAATTVGVAYGALAGTADGGTDDVMMRLVDVCLALPRILVLLAVIALWGHVSMLTLVLLLGLTGWFTLSRMVRAEVRSIRQREFVTAARALGASPREVTLRHVLPNLASTVITWATLDVGQVILLEAGLSFLGLGVQPPTPSWGNIMQDGADRLATLWWMSCFPGLMILITVGAVTLLGDRLRDALDPRELSRTMTAPVLAVRDLRTVFDTDRGTARAVDGVSFEVATGEAVGLVGESGCGKSVTALSLLRLIRPPGSIEAGSQIVFDGADLMTLDAESLRRIRGDRIAMVFQEPMTALNPVYTVGDQVAEVLRVHGQPGDAWGRAVEMLRLTGIPDPGARARAYPHQLSGGMRQRVMIAMALIMHPALVVADEPTTALDVTVQAQILGLLADLRERFHTALLLITHDLGVIAESTSRVIVMYAGEVVEMASVDALFAMPHHPYTRGLLKAVPRLSDALDRRDRLADIPGAVPPATDWPSGCRFRARCASAWERCAAEHPPLYQIGSEHTSRCHLADEPGRRR